MSKHYKLHGGKGEPLYDMSIPKIASIVGCLQGTVWNRLAKLEELKGE